MGLINKFIAGWGGPYCMKGATKAANSNSGPRLNQTC